ncbi:MAG: hypothetical protein NC085_14135, partial [Muribaculaceae bacterium]|nr:hypothetical protein [Muribaculaceae bacterium]
VKRCHGNIGNCRDWLEGAESSENIELCGNIAAAIADNNEYAVLAALHKIGDNRGRVKAVLEMLDKVIRDACMLRLGNIPLIGCDPEEAERLSRTLSRRRAEKLHEAIRDSALRCETPINVPAEVSALVCKIMG